MRQREPVEYPHGLVTSRLGIPVETRTANRSAKTTQRFEDIECYRRFRPFRITCAYLATTSISTAAPSGRPAA